MRSHVWPATWLSLLLSVPAAAQQLSRLIDTNPNGNGHAYVLRGTGDASHAWLVGGGVLWRTDGTQGGTQARSVAANVAYAREIGDRLFYAPRSAANEDLGLVVLDPSGATTQLLPANSGVTNLLDLHGELLFGRTTVSGAWPNLIYTTAWWLSDGTIAGTRPAPFIPYDMGNPFPLWRLNGDVLIPYNYGLDATLHITDGRTDTVIATVSHSGNQGFDLHAYSTGRELFFFVAVQNAVGTMVRELWHTDGTAAGTGRVYDPAQAGRPWLLQVIGCIGDLAYFVGGPSASELWRTDGTAAGTVLVTNLGATASTYRAHPVDGGIYFLANGANGLEPMFTDGTAAGTRSLGDLTPNGDSSDFLATSLGGGAALLSGTFGGADSAWLSEGTAASTRRLLALSPTLTSHWTVRETLTRGHLLFEGTDASGDREIWTIDGIAAAQPLGVGAPANAAPILAADRPALGHTVSIALRNAPANAAGLLVLGLEPAQTGLFAGALPVYVDLNQPTLHAIFGTDASGAWSVAVPMPNLPVLAGLTLAMQAAVQSSSAVGIDASNGLLLTPGN